MKIADIIKSIETTAPLPAAAPWDASGVQVAGMRSKAASVAVLLDPSLAGLTQAAEAGAGFILSHHPLSLQPRFPDRQDEYLAILSLLFSRDIWLYSAHTSLDANPHGPVRWLALALHLTDIRVLESSLPESGYGFGFMGILAEPLDYESFCRKLTNALGKASWRICGPKPKQVTRVACCPGSGGNLLSAAIASGADVFLTGDIKYHTALDSLAAGLRILDVGHFVLEEEMMRRFAGQLASELDIPVHFFPSRDPLCEERLSST